MIQSGIHFAPILRQNQFELQSRDDSVDFGPPSLRFILSPVMLRANPRDRYRFWKACGRVNSIDGAGCLSGGKNCCRQTALPPCGRSSLVFASSVSNDFVSCLLSCLKMSAKASNSELQCLLFTLPRSWIRRWRPRWTPRSSRSCWRGSTRWAEAGRAMRERRRRLD